MTEPPRSFERWLRKALPHGQDWMSILGDLREEFDGQVRLQGVRRARWWYRAQAARLASSYAATRIANGLIGPWRRLPQDVRYAGRILRRDRGASAVIVFTLTVGIAATSTMFGVVDRLLLRPPPGIGHADQVRRVYFGSGAAAQWRPNQSYPTLKRMVVTSGLADGALVHRTGVTLGAGPAARQVTVELATAAYFPLLELTPAVGRFYTPTEDRRADADPVVVLSHAFWRSAFGADPSAVGRDLLVEGTPLTILGVVPEGFSGARGEGVDLWAPPGALARQLFREDWAVSSNFYYFELIGRVAPGAIDMDVSDQVTSAYRQALAADGSSEVGDARAIVTSLNGLGRPNGLAFQARVGLWLLGVSAVLVLIACANVAGLQLARALGRRREFAIRVAIGASRRRLFGQLLTESALLAVLAGLAALCLTWFTGRLVQQLLVVAGEPWDGGAANGRMLAATAGITMAAAVISGLAPALQAWSTDVIGAVRPGGTVALGRAGRLRSALLLAQVALSVLLLVGAGLFVRSLAAVRAHDVGIDLDRVIQAALPSTAAPPLYAEAVERLSVLPDVQRVAVNGGSLRLSVGRSQTLTTEDMPDGAAGGPSMDAYFVVSDEYFDTLGTRVDSGRGFSAEDDRLAARVAVINRGFADRFWPGLDAVGRCVDFGVVFSRANCTMIVGVVENTLLHNRTTGNEAQIFVLASHPGFSQSSPNALLIRTRGDAREALPAVRDVLQSLTPDMGFVAVDTLEAMLAPQLQPWRLGSAVFLGCGVIAMLIAGVGLYAALAFAVSQRTQEIGIRIVLGASPGSVTRAIGRSSAVVVAGGLLLGLLAAALSTRWLSDLLFQTSPRDPLVFVSAAGALALVGVAAAVVPVRRAAAVDPIRVLRDS